MNSATMQAPSQTQSRSRGRSGTRSSIPAGATSTPGAMIPAQADAAASSPKEIDHGAIVLQIASVQNKATGAQRMVSNKSKQHIFALSCAAVASLLGMERFDKDGKPIHIPDEHAAKLKLAINDLWDSQWNRFKAYGGALHQSDIRFAFDLTACKPVPMVDEKGNAVLNADGKQKLDILVRKKATAMVTADAKDVSEAILMVSLSHKSALNRLSQMQERVGAYTRDEIRDQQNKVTAFEAKLLVLADEKARLARVAKGIEALDQLLSVGKITNDEYATKRKEIETAA